MNETFHMRGSLYNASKMTQKFEIMLNIILLRLKPRTFLRGKKLKKTMTKSPVICLRHYSYILREVPH